MSAISMKLAFSEQNSTCMGMCLVDRSEPRREQ